MAGIRAGQIARKSGVVFGEETEANRRAQKKEGCMKKVVTIERHLEKISRLKPNGQWNVGYYARFRSWNHRYFEKRLSSDLQTASRLLKRYELLNDEKNWPLVFPEELAEAERQRQEQQRANAMTVAKFAAIYKELPEIKAKRSADRDAQHLA